MKKTFFFLFFFISLLIIKKLEAITIITPEDGSYVSSSFFYVVGRVQNPSATHIVVTVNDLKSPLIYIKDPEYISQFKDFFIIDLELEQGENLIGIKAFKDNVQIEEKKIKVNKVGKYEELPKGKKRYFFHSPVKEESCTDCHKIDKESCLECHKGIISRKYVHGPAGSGDCDVCHSFSEVNGYKYSLKEDIENICFECHSDMKKDNFKYLHGPFAVGNCNLCHNVHSSDYPQQLLFSVNELCKTCHTEFKEKGKVHVLPKHPLENRKDPSRPGKDLSCASCHNPHGQEGNLFFPQGKKSRMEICGICHKK
ncbi:MAG: cytochrome c3 family protein [Proteobacteria bacterium]|nr:cytochrome c3 family protein [Pseudomonadota bacterium]